MFHCKTKGKSASQTGESLSIKYNYTKMCHEQASANRTKPWPSYQLQTRACVYAGSAKANGREPESCLGRVFNLSQAILLCMQLHGKYRSMPQLRVANLAHWPRFCPVRLRLSMQCMPCSVCHAVHFMQCMPSNKTASILN